MLKAVGVSLSLLLVVAVAGVAGLTIGNAVATSDEEAAFTPYGERVAVGTKQMNVVVQGEGPQTIVLLPDLQTSAPGIDFAPLVGELSDRFRVVVVEPFGSGLSDPTDAPRTTERVAKEIHAALAALGVERYAVAAAGSSGITALDYVNRYRGEVTALVGLDASVPVQREGLVPDEDAGQLGVLKSLGIYRQLYSAGPDPFEGLPYSDEQKQDMHVLALRNAYGPTYLAGIDAAPGIFSAAREQRLPADLPVLLLYSASSERRNWPDLQQEFAATVGVGQAVAVDGPHDLHRVKSAEIAAAITEFLAAHTSAS